MAVFFVGTEKSRDNDIVTDTSLASKDSVTGEVCSICYSRDVVWISWIGSDDSRDVSSMAVAIDNSTER